MRLVALSPAAVKQGLACGMALADARGLAPGLVSLPYEPGEDAVLLNRMMRYGIRYTPSVMIDPPQGLLFDITGCTHLHGSEGAMLKKIAAGFRQRGHAARLACADTPDAARALARFGGRDARALPLDALEVDDNTLTALRRAGFRSIGELTDLPAAPLAARFGPDLVRLLDRLMAREDPHIVPQQPAQAIKADLRFAEPIGRDADVLDAIEWLIGEAATQLEKAGKGGRAFAVHLYRSDGCVARLEVETSAPTRDSAVLMRLFTERIGSLADPLDPGFGYDSIDLCVTRAEPLEVIQRSLAPETEQGEGIDPLFDRLAVRYGPAAILRFAAGNSHLPERAGLLARPPDAEASAHAWPGREPGEPPLRPLFLFDPPQPVEVLAAIPDGPPRRFRWRGVQHLVRLYEGPERITPEWWRRRDGYDNPGFSRDYYRVEDDEGHRFWLIRHGLYERGTSEPRWYVHGLFA